LNFAGPVHTNGDLYPLAGTGATVTFHYKVSAFGNVIRTRLPNGIMIRPPIMPATCTFPPPTVIVRIRGQQWREIACSCRRPPMALPTEDSRRNGCGGHLRRSQRRAITTPIGLLFLIILNYEITNGNYGSNVANATGRAPRNCRCPSSTGTTFVERADSPARDDRLDLAEQSREIQHGADSRAAERRSGGTAGGATDANNVRLANITQTVANGNGGTASNPYGIQNCRRFVSDGLAAAGAGNTYNQYFARRVE